MLERFLGNVDMSKFVLRLQASVLVSSGLNAATLANSALKMVYNAHDSTSPMCFITVHPTSFNYQPAPRNGLLAISPWGATQLWPCIDKRRFRDSG